MKQAQTERHAPTLVLGDKFLLKHFSEYAHSLQRFALASRLDLYGPSGQSGEYFIPVKAEINKVPPKKRVDLCERFLGLPPLTEELFAACAPPLEDAVAIRKLKKTIIPEAFFRPPATILDAVCYFRHASRDYDKTGASGDGKGLNFVMRVPNVGDYIPGFGDALVPPHLFWDDWSDDCPVVTIPPVHSISLYDLLGRVCDLSGMAFKIKDGVVVIFPLDGVQDGGGPAVRGIVTMDMRPHKLLLVGESDQVRARPTKQGKQIPLFASNARGNDCCCCSRYTGDQVYDAVQPAEVYHYSTGLSLNPTDRFVSAGGVFSVTGIEPSRDIESDAFIWRTGYNYNCGTYTVVDLKLGFSDAEPDGVRRRVMIGQTNVIHVLTKVPASDGDQGATLSFSSHSFVSDVTVKSLRKREGYDALPGKIPVSEWFSKYARMGPYTAEIRYIATVAGPRTFTVTYSVPGAGSVSASLDFVAVCAGTEQTEL